MQGRGTRVLLAITAIVAGLVCDLALAYVCNQVTLNVWPAYAAAYPNRTFTLPMLLSRQAVGLAVTIAGGFVASAIARQDQRPVLWLGILGLAGGVWVHLHEPTWSNYPLWYHLFYFSYLIPGPLLGGRLNQRWHKRRRIIGVR
jgi:hypothetical protein